MTRWFGVIGYAVSGETAPGVWQDTLIEREYYGDIHRNARRLQSSDKLNDDVLVNNELSIISDPYAIENFHHMRYAEFMGTKWKISNVEVQYPRLILTLGGVYSEQ